MKGYGSGSASSPIYIEDEDDVQYPNLFIPQSLISGVASSSTRKQNNKKNKNAGKKRRREQTSNETISNGNTVAGSPFRKRQRLNNSSGKSRKPSLATRFEMSQPPQDEDIVLLNQPVPTGASHILGHSDGASWVDDQDYMSDEPYNHPEIPSFGGPSHIPELSPVQPSFAAVDVSAPAHPSTSHSNHSSTGPFLVNNQHSIPPAPVPQPSASLWAWENLPALPQPYEDVVLGEKQTTIGMLADKDRKGLRSSFNPSSSTFCNPGAAYPVMPIVPKTLVLDQLPKHCRHSTFLTEWCRNAGGEMPEFWAIDSKSAKALVQFSSYEVANKAWNSPLLMDTSLNGVNDRQDLIRAWFYNPRGVPAVFASPGVPPPAPVPLVYRLPVFSAPCSRHKSALSSSLPPLPPLPRFDTADPSTSHTGSSGAQNQPAIASLPPLPNFNSRRSSDLVASSSTSPFVSMSQPPAGKANGQAQLRPSQVPGKANPVETKQPAQNVPVVAGSAALPRARQDPLALLARCDVGATPSNSSIAPTSGPQAVSTSTSQQASKPVAVQAPFSARPQPQPPSPKSRTSAISSVRQITAPSREVTALPPASFQPDWIVRQQRQFFGLPSRSPTPQDDSELEEYDEGEWTAGAGYGGPVDGFEEDGDAEGEEEEEDAYEDEEMEEGEIQELDEQFEGEDEEEEEEDDERLQHLHPSQYDLDWKDDSDSPYDPAYGRFSLQSDEEYFEEAIRDLDLDRMIEEAEEDERIERGWSKPFEVEIDIPVRKGPLSSLVKAPTKEEMRAARHVPALPIPAARRDQVHRAWSPPPAILQTPRGASSSVVDTGRAADTQASESALSMEQRLRSLVMKSRKAKSTTSNTPVQQSSTPTLTTVIPLPTPTESGRPLLASATAVASGSAFESTASAAQTMRHMVGSQTMGSPYAGTSISSSQLAQLERESSSSSTDDDGMSGNRSWTLPGASPPASPREAKANANAKPIARTLTQQAVVFITETLTEASKEQEEQVEKEKLADRQRRLEASIAEHKRLMDLLGRARTKEEKASIWGKIKNLPKWEKEASFGPQGYVTKAARVLNIRWPETRPEDCILELSDDEDEDS